MLLYIKENISCNVVGTLEEEILLESFIFPHFQYFKKSWFSPKLSNLTLTPVAR